MKEEVKKVIEERIERLNNIILEMDKYPSQPEVVKEIEDDLFFLRKLHHALYFY